MNAARIMLQVIILCSGAIILIPLIAQPAGNVTAIIVIGGLMAFLFALTLMLREYTEKRQITGRRLSFKYMGIALMLLGTFDIFYGFSFLLGQQPLPDGSESCRTICTLIRSTSVSFGETAATLLAFCLHAVLGIFIFICGYKVKGAREV